MKKHYKFIIAAVLLFVIVELVLRKGFGFCDTVLMQESKNYEYIAQPNQERYRFGSYIAYNNVSMRSEAVDSSSTKILCFGDSVINGGVLTDQDALATTMLSNEFSEIYNKNVQFLNISAGSWGPDNCYAYLREKGDFDAQMFILFVSSHDAYDNMEFDKVVDSLASFPSQQYALAGYELWDRYLSPRIKSILKKREKKNFDNLGINKKKDFSKLNTGFQNFNTYCKENNIPFMIYLHAEKGELNIGKYNQQGQQIIGFAQENDIPLITDLDSGLEASDFHDVIHLNEKGQKNIFLNVLKTIRAKRFRFLE